jgi:hypothetical protein
MPNYVERMWMRRRAGCTTGPLRKPIAYNASYRPSPTAAFRMVEHTVAGKFTLTPPLPSPDTLPARLSDDMEHIERLPYWNCLLRLTVFPRAHDA